MSDFYDCHDEHENRTEQQSNDYSYYQTSQEEERRYTPFDIPEPERPVRKRKSGFGKKVAKAACLGLVFGLTAGGAFFGISKAAMCSIVVHIILLSADLVAESSG